MPSFSDPALILPGAVDTTEIADNAVTTGKIKDGEIVNVDIAAGAAIAVSKISGAETPAGAQTKVDALVISNSGQYSGDNTVKAIAHGLGRVPNGIMIYASTAYGFSIVKGSGALLNIHAVSSVSVAEPDNTDFTVGHASSWANSANASGNTYYWVAW